MLISEMTASQLSQLIRKEVYSAFYDLKKEEKPQKEFLTRFEASDYTTFSLPTLWKLNKTGELPAVKVGGKVFYEKSTLDQFLSSKKA